MLKPEDCKPGVEVVCIDARIGPSGLPNELVLGNIYVIESYIPETVTDFEYSGIFFTKNRFDHIILSDVRNIFLFSTGRFSIGYDRLRFKLRRKEDMQQFYDLLGKPLVKELETV